MRYFFIGCAFALLALLTFSADAAMAGAVQGLALFSGSVFPALFPFIVTVNCLKRFGAFPTEARLTPHALLRLFPIACISGSPSGSLLVSGASSTDAVKVDAEGTSNAGVFSALLNLSSPVFILGTVGRRLLASAPRNAAPLIALSHYGSALICLCASIVFDKLKSPKRRKLRGSAGDIGRSVCGGAPVRSKRNEGSYPDVSSVFPAAIYDAVRTMLTIGATLVFFVTLGAVIERAGILAALHPAVRALVFGMLEMTNGIALIAAAEIGLELKLVLICFLLSFGGICIYMQASSVAPVDAADYLGAKLAQAFCSALLCNLLFPLFIGESAAVFGDGSMRLTLGRALTAGEIMLLLAGGSVFSSLLAVYAARRTRT